MTGAKLDKLVRMANQIGDFYAAMPEAEATAATAAHLRSYWTPKMIGELAAFVDGHADLNPTAARAVEALSDAPSGSNPAPRPLSRGGTTR